MERLKNCSFCGGKPTICDNSWAWFAHTTLIAERKADRFWVECAKCAGRTAGYDSEKKAIKAWNSRASE